MSAKRDHLLLVDDDPGFVKTVRDVAKSFGLEVEIHPTAEAAIDRFEGLPDSERLRYLVAAVEIALPKTSGVELAWRLRKLSPALVIAAVSKDLGIWDTEELRECGVNRVLMKPVRREDLQQWLGDLIGRDSGTSDSAAVSYYEGVATELSIERRLPYARVIDEDRVVLYENGAVARDFGPNVGRSHMCFALFGSDGYCERCIVLEAIASGDERSKTMKLASGERYFMIAVPITRPDGRRGVVELAGPARG
jgi:CheY-like chemotaxis protein